MENQFSIGDMAVYPGQGVAEVVGIEAKEISGNPFRFYVLRIIAKDAKTKEGKDSKILVPVNRANEVGLRRIINEEEIREIFDILREKEIHVDKQTWNRRSRGFKEKINTGSLFDVAEVFRDLYRLKATKTLSYGEREMLDKAKKLIVKELSIARRTTEVKVERELEQVFLS